MSSEKSLIKNSIYNFAKTISGLAFPVISFAYASRILGVESIGRVYFAKNFVVYFSMIAQLGMNYYGTREASKLRDNRTELTTFSYEILIINAISTVIAYFLFAIAICVVPELKSYTILLVINSVSIALQGLGMEWLYQALEDYKYISVRLMLFQIIALVLMFLLVKDESDLIQYTIILIFAGTGSYILNFFHARKYIDFSVRRQLSLKKHIRPIFLLFAMSISIQLYAVLDSTMLGFLAGDYEVGKYTAAVKINKMLCNVITSLGLVLIPRLSYYFDKGETNKIQKLTEKSMNLIFMLSIPTFIGVFFLSRDILVLFSGVEFVEADLTTKILSALIIVIPFSIICNTQTFVPLGKEKYILISTFSGAIVNFTLNIILIPYFRENGAAIATLFSEITVATICCVNMSRLFDLKSYFQKYFQYWIASIPIPFIVIIGTLSIKNNTIARIIVTVMMSVLSYCLLMKYFNNPYYAEFMQKVKKLIPCKGK